MNRLSYEQVKERYGISLYSFEQLSSVGSGGVMAGGITRRWKAPDGKVFIEECGNGGGCVYECGVALAPFTKE